MPSDEEVLLQQEDARRAVAGAGSLLHLLLSQSLDSTMALVRSRAGSGSTCELCFHPDWACSSRSSQHTTAPGTTQHLSNNYCQCSALRHSQTAAFDSAFTHGQQSSVRARPGRPASRRPLRQPSMRPSCASQARSTSAVSKAETSPGAPPDFQALMTYACKFGQMGYAASGKGWEGRCHCLPFPYVIVPSKEHEQLL